MEIIRLIGISCDSVNVTKKCSIGVFSKGVTFTLSFMKIHQLSQKVK